MRVINLPVLFFVMLGLASCSHPRPPVAQETAHQENTPCSGDPYLVKFNCSLSKIQQRAASRGDPDAQYALGYMYYYGINTVQDVDSAKLWIARAASQGQPLAKQALALLKIEGTQGIRVAEKKSAPVKAASTKITQVQPVQVAVKARAVVPQLSEALQAQANNELGSMETELLHEPNTGYTLQLMGNHHLDVIKQFIAQNHLEAQAKYYHSNFHNSDWYMLLYGQYKTIEEAHMAIAQLPESIRKNSPWIKPNEDIQEEIRTKHLIS